MRSARSRCARIGGYLQTIEFVDGEIVQEGDLLFTIDPRSVEAALAEARAELESACAALTNTRDELDRAEQLLENGNISIQTVDERHLNLSCRPGKGCRRASLRRTRHAGY